MTGLALTIAVLLAAPWIDAGCRNYPAGHALLDAFGRVVAAGIVMIHVLPHAWALIGPWALFAGGLGFGALWLGERFHLDPAGERPFLVAAAAAGLGAHAFLDGAALGHGEEHGAQGLLGAAVVLHTLPVALVTWRLSVSHLSGGFGYALLAWSAVATALGFGLAEQAAAHVAEPVLGALQMFAAGGLLHALGHEVAPRDTPRASGAGVIAAVLALVVLAQVHPTPALHHGELAAELTFATLLVETSVAVVLGLGAAALIRLLAERRRWTLPRDPQGALHPVVLLVTLVLLGPVFAAVRLAVTVALTLLDRERADRDVDPAPAGWLGALLLAAFLEAAVDPGWLAAAPGFSHVLIALIVAAVAPLAPAPTTPLVAVLLHKGLDPGAALVLLGAGALPQASVRGRPLLVGVLVAPALVTPLVAGLLGGPELHLAALHDHGVIELVACALLVGLWAVALYRSGLDGFLAGEVHPTAAWSRTPGAR